MGDGQVCGTGAQCEDTCPVMRLGRLCPTLPEFLDELANLYAATPPQEAQQLAPQPA